VVTLCVLGGILGVLPAWLPEFKLTLPIPEILLALSGMVFTLLLIVLLRKGGSPVKLMLGLAVICLVLAFAGVI
jgi:mannose/fructose/N-acetylgalactosamine-specific phosphotransferase system component IID